MRDRDLVDLLAEVYCGGKPNERYVLCAMSHGQLVIGGYTIRPEHRHRWTRRQLAGRTVMMAGRLGRMPDAKA